MFEKFSTPLWLSPSIKTQDGDSLTNNYQRKIPIENDPKLATVIWDKRYTQDFMRLSFKIKIMVKKDTASPLRISDLHKTNY